ncbi:MAG: glycoside hydrolase family 10 protein [Cyanobacteriota bacterium]|nr:glycoside hydrolase family 10 protein [Cyanobacteriota bacterium]
MKITATITKMKFYGKLKRRLGVGITIALAILSLSAIAFSPPAPVTAANPAPQPTEIRGVWIANVASGVLFMPWAIDRALRQLAELNFNTIYPVVWNRGRTFYPSKLATKTIGYSQDTTLTLFRFGRDLLAEILTQGHRQGLRVIPWFEYGFMAPVNSQLVKRHPHWVTATRDLTKKLPKDIFELDVRDLLPEGEERSPLEKFQYSVSINNVWLNPIHPDVQNFVLGLILEVVEKYPVDGIQLDDRFAMPVELGYDPFTVRLYQQEHQGKSPPDNPRDAEWMGWRADKLTAFLERIYKAVKAVKPNCIVSVSPNPQNFAYKLYLQDWQTWIEKGIVDEIILQVYRNDPGKFKQELEKPILSFARSKVPVGIGILSGTWNNPVAIAQIKEQVRETRLRGFDGVSFFYWESLWTYMTPDPPQERRLAFKELFPTPVERGK